jgi:hypothetical protein
MRHVDPPTVSFITAVFSSCRSVAVEFGSAKAAISALNRGMERTD